jgi:hypothetical protein
MLRKSSNQDSMLYPSIVINNKQQIKFLKLYFDQVNIYFKKFQDLKKKFQEKKISKKVEGEIKLLLEDIEITKMVLKNQNNTDLFKKIKINEELITSSIEILKFGQDKEVTAEGNLKKFDINIFYNNLLYPKIENINNSNKEILASLESLKSVLGNNDPIKSTNTDKNGVFIQPPKQQSPHLLSSVSPPKQQSPHLLSSVSPSKQQSPLLPVRSPRIISRSHSFVSNSPYSKGYRELLKTVVIPYETNENAIYLINVIGEGECFINAIFDYGIYTGSLIDIYKRLSALEKLIKKIYINDTQSTENISNIFQNFSVETCMKEYINDNSSLSGNIGNNLATVDKELDPYNFDKVQYLIHNNKVGSYNIYEKNRKNFVKSMKYLLCYYVFTYGKKKFREIIKNIFLINVLDKTFPEEYVDWHIDLREYICLNFYSNTKEDIKKRKYNITCNNKGNINPTDLYNDDFIDKFIFEYMRLYANNPTFYVNEEIIIIFKKILFKKIKETNGKIIKRFVLDIETFEVVTSNDEKGILKFTKVNNIIRGFQNFRFQNDEEVEKKLERINKKYIHKSQEHEYISLLIDRNITHYLLFLPVNKISINLDIKKVM